MSHKDCTFDFNFVTLVSPDISADRPGADPQVREQGQPARHAGGVHLRHALPPLQGEVPQGVLAKSTGM